MGWIDWRVGDGHDVWATLLWSAQELEWCLGHIQHAAACSLNSTCSTGHDLEDDRYVDPPDPRQDCSNAAAHTAHSFRRRPLIRICVQEYFSSSVSAVRQVVLNYGPNGRSRGIATVLFNDPNAAAKAVKLDGTRVDGRPLKVS